MSATITIDEAQAKLKELIHQLAPGEEVVITENSIVSADSALDSYGVTRLW